MKKITIEIEVSDSHDEEEALRHLNGPKAYSVLWDFDQALRSGVKYSLPEDLKAELKANSTETGTIIGSDNYSSEQLVIQYYRKLLSDMLQEAGIEL